MKRALRSFRIALIILGLTWVVAEGMGYFIPNNFYLKESELIHTDVSLDLLQSSPYVIFKPNVKVEVVRQAKTTGEVVYQSQITIDALSRRKIENSPKEPKRNLLLLGDSFTFGTGVNDDQTFAQLLQNALPDTKVLNLGLPAAGPQDVYEDIVEGNRTKDLSPIKSISIYTGIDNHLERFLCRTWRCFDHDRTRDNNSEKNSYQLEGSVFVNRGKFKDQISLSHLIMKALSLSHLLELSTWDRALYTEKDFELYARFFSQLKNKLAEKDSSLLYVFYPKRSRVFTNRLLPYFKKHEIDFLDLSQFDLNAATSNSDFIPYDGHPTPAAHKVFSELLFREIKKSLP